MKVMSNNLVDKISDMPEGYTQKIAAKLSALELEFDLESNLKLIEDSLMSKEKEKDR